MAITAALVTALGGGNIDYVPITPNAPNFEVTLPAGTWLVQIEVASSALDGFTTVTAGGAMSTVLAGSSFLLTRVVSGGTLTGSTNNKFLVKYTHGIAIRLGD